MQDTNNVATTIETLLAENKIPEQTPQQMSALLHYMFHDASATLRMRVAEVVFRHGRDHQNGKDLFLACVLPIAERTARRRAGRLLHPSEWTFEAMYDGAVNAVIEMFQKGELRGTQDNAFRRYLRRSLAHGTSRYFMRTENLGIATVSDIQRVRPFDSLRGGSTRTRALNTAEERMITRDLLEKAINYPGLPDGPRATLQCIGTLGPDVALKEHPYTASGDPDKWKRQRGNRPILNPNAIAAAMNTQRMKVHVHLRQARIILREAFNSDGKLFQHR